MQLTPEIENLIKEEMATGEFVSPSDVLINSKKLSFEERRKNLRYEIQKGIDEIRNGNFKTYNADQLDDLMTEIITEGKARLESKRQKRLKP